MKLIRESIQSLLVLTVLTGLLYPLALTGVAQLLFPRQANGSLIERNNKVIGSELLAQDAKGDPKYFWPRPSATTPNPDNAASSSGSNLGPLNPDLKKAIDARRKATPGAPIDLLTASASGLDPHITPEAARYQAVRVAQARRQSPGAINALVEKHVEGRQLGFLGEPRVNVMLLNLDLDAAH